VLPTGRKVGPDSASSTGSAGHVGALKEIPRVGASLFQANLVGANLSRADLGSANLAGANLTGADLIEANLRKAYVETSISVLSGDMRR
jgi:hypothetical protein